MAVSSGNITDEMIQHYIDEQEGEPVNKKLAVEKNNEILYLEYSSDSHNLSDIQI
jgi:hypothetical protein